MAGRAFARHLGPATAGCIVVESSSLHERFSKESSNRYHSAAFNVRDVFAESLHAPRLPIRDSDPRTTTYSNIEQLSITVERQACLKTQVGFLRSRHLLLSYNNSWILACSPDLLMHVCCADACRLSEMSHLKAHAEFLGRLWILRLRGDVRWLPPYASSPPICTSHPSF